MSSGMFKDKHFSKKNRIILISSRRIEISLFRVLPPFGGVGGFLGGWMGCGWLEATPTHARTHTSTHARARVCTRMYARMRMYAQ